MSREVSAAAAKRLLHDGGEIAVLDVREAGEFGEGHPLFAVPCPYSGLEATVTALVPRRGVRVLLIDGGDGVAERAARALGALGYDRLSLMAGGAPAWAAAGHGLFKGVNVPSKTLGELAEQIWHPKTVDAATLARWRAEGRPLRLFDARPPAEYAKMRVPGAVCLPNGELAHRFEAAVENPADPVVVTCAGRTRGIVGVIGLSLVGIDAPLYALENGTQGWALAGFDLERGNAAAPFPELDEAARRITGARATAFLDRHRIPVFGREEVEGWRADGERTNYLLDLRTAHESAADPAPAFVSAPSGQLVQATDRWVGVRHARLVLLDDLGLRAGIAAFWLRQLGFEVAVARLDDGLRSLPPSPAGPRLSARSSVPAASAWQAVSAGIGRLVDIRPSTAYRTGHVAGALWGIRPRLGRLPLERRVPVYLVADDPQRGALAAKEFEDLGFPAVHLVDGGHAALAAAGAPVADGRRTLGVDEAIDHLTFVHDRHDGNLEASRRYLAWEQGLIGQLDADERAEFVLAQGEQV